MGSFSLSRTAGYLASLAVCLALAVLLFGCSSGYSSNNPPPPDTTPPTAPSGLTATAASSTQINLSWTASTDNVGVTGYQIQRCQGASCANFAQVGPTTTATTFNDTGLTASTSYSYRVSASDAAANISAFSAVMTATTQAGADTTPPTAPSSLTATATSSTQINLTWTASTDNVGVASYELQRCQGPGCANFALASIINVPTATAVADASLTPATSYSYRLLAKDAAGNASTFSNTASATTQAASGPIAVTISPRAGGLTITQTLSATATVTGDSSAQGVTWTATAGTFSTASTASGTPVTYTAPGTAGSVTITATSKADATKFASATIGVTDLTGVFTYQNDNQRTGQNTHEFALTPANVNATNFGRLFSCDTTEGGAVRGHIYAQPLYVANLTINGTKHNVLFVVTESDWVYAFDADANPCQTLWKASMLDFNSTPKHDPIPGETTVPAADTGEVGDLIPEIGITSTPVIDTATNTIYLTAKSKESSTSYHHRLHALDLATGSEKTGSPVEINAAAPGTGFAFVPLGHMQRPALLLSGNTIYLAFGSHGDQGNYHGWLIGYNQTTLVQSSVWVATDTSVTGTLGAIWQSGAGPATDASGNIWVEIANGNFDTGIPRINFGDSVVKLNATGTAPLDFFTPLDQDKLRMFDVDLGSGGVTILPSSVGPVSHPLAIATGKTNRLYVLDQTNLGQFSSISDNVLQELTLPNGLNENTVIAGMFSKAAYFNGKIYVLAINDILRSYAVNAVSPYLTAGATGADNFGFPGATPAVSSQLTSNGIVWVLNTHNNNTPNGSGTSSPAVLFAYDASTLNKLYSSPASAGAGAAVNAIKFMVPTIANGKVYVAGQGGVTAFGLLP